jgi:hemerythrin-like domain-containing protein
MHAAISTLMNEHRVIEQVLAVLEHTAASAEQGAAVDRNRIAEIGEFLAGFADRCHHAKEEDLLFAAMVEAGMPREQGPIAVMLAEHTEGRALVSRLRGIGAGTGPLSAAERASLGADGSAYAALLGQHIAKEDRILYPMALRAMSAEALDRVARAYEQHELAVMGRGEHERLHALADRLIATLPSAQGAKPELGCHSCHH